MDPELGMYLDLLSSCSARFVPWCSTRNSTPRYVPTHGTHRGKAQFHKQTFWHREQKIVP